MEGVPLWRELAKAATMVGSLGVSIASLLMGFPFVITAISGLVFLVMVRGWKD